ncbi:MAG TPA: DUF302 domain-containing protein [Gammaproteobacteria bacterium]|nr:DUF302 domain-containing protein [Gammaproteobacteria bacterium]
MMRCWPLVICFLLAACSQKSADPSTSDSSGKVETHAYQIVRATTDKSFEDVVEELEFAISDHNYRITGTNNLGKALRERGNKDFPDVEVIHFCSVENAREVLQMDLGYVAMMPCRITVHVQDKKTVISLILLPEDHPNPKVNEFARRTNAEMRRIMDFALQQNAVGHPLPSTEPAATP